MGRNLDEIRRLRERVSGPAISAEEATAERLAVKNRIIGVLLNDARRGSARSVQDCAALLSLTEDEYLAFEQGLTSPTLPQLEILAYYFNVPISHFWAGDTLAVKRQEDMIKERVPDVLMLRQQIIGVQMRQLREDAEMSVEQVAEASGIATEDIQALETGQIALSLSELELLAYTVKSNLDTLIDPHGPVGGWLQAQEDFEAFSELPAEMRQFILKRINRSYLELAMRLSDMEVTKLRTIAESILDITL
jgi:transcriptional regulator with XRE-family HTH domain